MGPREAAALVAREADAGVAAAFGAMDSTRILVPESVIARVSSVPPGADDLDDVVWQAEIHLRVSEVDHVADGSHAGVGVDSSPVADLPVDALLGSGPVWSGLLVSAGFATIGELAAATSAQVAALSKRLGTQAVVLAGRSRIAAQPWPTLPPDASSWGTVLDVARTDPAEIRGDRVTARAFWAFSVQLASAVDARMLKRIRLHPSSG